MTYEEFKEHCNSGVAEPELSPYLVALWYDATGNWERAHEIVQEIPDRNASWIHAYLHRKEGDSGNASYWYSQAAKSICDDSLEEEWGSLVRNFLNQT